MAKTVNEAFNTFLNDVIRLDPERTNIARASKVNLVKEIGRFPSDGIFPILHPDLSIDYGSFSRKTKTRPLDDIDMMILLHAQKCYYTQYYDRFEITVDQSATTLLSLCNDNSYTLNSRKVVNKFKDYLSKVPKYEKADVKRNQEAATLKLSSYEWVYDIVPSFITTADLNGVNFYLIPDGNGSWKKTDPRIDKNRTISINALQTVSVLDVVRVFKFWTGRATMPTMGSYYLENLILNYFNSGVTSVTYIDMEIPNVLANIYHNVENGLNDPKGFQGNINNLTYEERQKVKSKASEDYFKAVEARRLEKDGKMSESINKWREIFGDQFPIYY